ncbi:nitroreductase family deazaflavin-dependent oxidoreductase [Mycolicibacterium sp. 120270]|uniref:nitroreductase family deazaflavin-dependent oxidoreductase n=1 Tax=Mycolicibacterium sp. 120270 TaxID=3090600 RepID=UPI00299E8527|nr:nitroreductase family deazaflavin-dependent oxidoreductase [Mycolicibacterium sp. 120270]MDX1882692.1 nitroreductase family deazaflavin-dependent oxidoreductase [Mycolicibacterium sp. 120270]
MFSTETVNGIPRVDLETRPRWKRDLAWWFGGNLVATPTGGKIWRKVFAPLEPPLMKATRGRLRVSVGAPIVVLTSIGARSGEPRDIPLTYFTDGDSVILIASNFGGARHPAWYHNLIANPECELHIGERGGKFVAQEVTGPDRDRLLQLAANRLTRAFELYPQRAGSRTIPVMRLTPKA